MEGILNILGVRWTLSGSVVGYHNFKPDLNRKKHKKGRNLSSSSSRNLKFVVIKSLPKLDGCLQHIPKKAYAGDLRLLVLELKNQSKFSVKNLKVKISHPRFLIPGRLKDMDVEFPAGLQKQISRECSDAQTNIVEKPNGLLFSFPDATIQGGTTFFWPLWLHAGSSGSTSFYLSIYYEMENSSSDMSYRTLRMHYNLEVLPSLDVAVKITPCSSRLQDFLVRMDITNRTNSECFWLRQLSSVGYQWKISSLSPDVSICPSQLLLTGQALSCFFKLKDHVKSVTTEGTGAAPDMDPENDASLGSQGNHEALLDITRSPLTDFHRHERSHFEKSIQNCLSTVDFILLSQPQEDETNIEPRCLLGSPRLYSHHTCLCSIGGVSPILWLMNGPRTVEHDFSVSFCEIRLHMTIRSCSDVAAVVKIHAFDSVETNQELSDGVQSYSSGNQPGWHSISLSNDLKVLTNFQETQSGQPPSQGISSFVWSASSSTQVLLMPMSTAEIPLQICIFSPGTYDLSNYAVHWNLQLSDAEGSSAIGATRQSSGTGPGHPYYLTALQSP